MSKIGSDITWAKSLARRARPTQVHILRSLKPQTPQSSCRENSLGPNGDNASLSGHSECETISDRKACCNVNRRVPCAQNLVGGSVPELKLSRQRSPSGTIPGYDASPRSRQGPVQVYTRCRLLAGKGEVFSEGS